MIFDELISGNLGLSEKNRPIRLRLSTNQGVFDDALLVKQVTGQESLCGGIEYRILCVATNPALPLKEFIALPVELQFVTDRGQLRSVCGIVSQASAGRSDGGLATYQLVARDALALMHQRTNTRVFRNKSELDISVELLNEWRAFNPILAKSFDIDTSGIENSYPGREFIMQHNESDAAFLCRLWRRRGMSWFIRPGKSSEHGSSDTPAHTLVLFDASKNLERNAAGIVHYLRDRATLTADTIFNWSAVRTLKAGSITRQSWNYRNDSMTFTDTPTNMQQGHAGSQFAFSLDDYVIDSPHAGDDLADYRRLGELRMQRHEYEAKCFHGEGAVRDLCVGQWIRLDGHPDIDSHPENEREFVITELTVDAENNLPKTMDDEARRLFVANGWLAAATTHDLQALSAARDMRYTNRFSCVRRGTPIVPHYDPRLHLPRVALQSAIVVGPADEEVHCDAMGRVKLRFPGTRERDHRSGPGASNSAADSAWVRVVSSWASDRWGSIHLPRVGDEVLVDFLGGDPDKPVIVGRVYGKAIPPEFSHMGDLPGNRFIAGIKSKEVKGMRYNQLRLDDTQGQISSQLACEHAYSQLNLGWLTHPRRNGRGKVRGEGAELRSDGAVVIRGASGVFISADSQHGAEGNLLQRDSLLGMAEVLKSIQLQLSELSETHLAGTTPPAKLDRMIERLTAWEAASNVDPEGSDGQAPIVAISAPAGVAVTSAENVLLGAQTEIDFVSGGNIQQTAGKSFLVRAAEKVSIFAHSLGMKLIAASGKMELQTHRDDIEMISAKRIVLSAADEIILQAPTIRFMAAGAQVDIGADQIVEQCRADFTIKSATFAHVVGGGGGVPDLKFPVSEMKTDERIVLFDPQSGRPVTNRGYRAVLADGQVIEGRTDAEGRTELMRSFGMSEVEITIDAHDDLA